MMDSYITKIQVNKARNIRDLTIPLSDNERKHLIITGKNGSGKTSLLEEMCVFLQMVDNGKYQHYFNYIDQIKSNQTQLAQLEKQPQPYRIKNQISSIKNNTNSLNNHIRAFGGTEISFTNSDTIAKDTLTGNFLITYFDAKRHTQLNVPGGIAKVDLKKKYTIHDRAGLNFIQYLVNLKAEKSFAKDDGEKEVVQKIDEWFTRFEKSLQSIFQSPDLKLKFDRKNFDFQIIEGDKLPFTFNTLADGYSAILNIVTELILRMEAHGRKAYDMEGIVLIDEIETHLHVELQKKVLPFLTDFFPKQQFIVTTHSPFVLSSLSNAVICDLETRLVTEDLYI